MLEPIQTRSFGDTIFYTELGGVYECGEVNCETVHRWKKKFLAGTASVKLKMQQTLLDQMPGP